MHINLQIKVLVWLYAALLVLLIGAGLGLSSLIRIIKTGERWSLHSVEVTKSNSEAYQAFAEAETKGRYAAFDDTAKNQLPALRSAAITKAEQTLQLVSDNPVQTRHAQAILSSVRERFETQDKQIGTAVLVEGRLQSSPAVMLEGIDAQNRAAMAFTVFENEEQKILLERLSGLSLYMWRTVKTFCGIGILSFAALMLAFGWTWHTLKSVRRAIKELRSKTNGDGRFDDLIRLMEQRG